MPGFNPDNINIHDLTIEEPEKQVETFDQEKDITPEDLEQMKQTLKKGNEAISYDQYVHPKLAMRFKTLYPNEDLLNEGLISEFSLEKMRTELEDLKSKKWLDTIPERAATLKIVDPAESLVLDESIWSGMEEIFNDRIRSKAWSEVFEKIIEMKILDSSRDFSKTYQLEEKDWEDYKASVDQYKTQNNWIMWYHKLIQAKILYPERDLGIDGNDWQRMRDELELYRELGKYANFADQTFYMKVLASKKVNITDKGLEIIMPEEKLLEPETPAVPEIKNF